MCLFVLLCVNVCLLCVNGALSVLSAPGAPTSQIKHCVYLYIFVCYYVFICIILCFYAFISNTGCYFEFNCNIVS